MLKNLFTIVCLHLLMALGGLNAQSGITFFEGSPEQLREKALQEGRPYMLYVYMQECLPCQQLEADAFKDPHLLSSLNQRRVLVGRIRGSQSWRGPGSNDVQMFPTIILVNAKGELQYKKAGYVGAQQLEEMLFQLDPPEPQPAPLAQPQFGIQVGVFSSYENAQRKKAELKAWYTEPVMLMESFRGGRTLVHVLVGPFPSREAAASFKRGYDWDHSVETILKNLTDFEDR